MRACRDHESNFASVEALLKEREYTIEERVVVLVYLNEVRARIDGADLLDRRELQGSHLGQDMPIPREDNSQCVILIKNFGAAPTRSILKRLVLEQIVCPAA